MTSAAVAEKLAPAGLYQQMRREVNNASRSAEAKDLGAAATANGFGFC